jgi:DNA-binding transcriptional ArsR family regulator
LSVATGKAGERFAREERGGQALNRPPQLRAAWVRTAARHRSYDQAQDRRPAAPPSSRSHVRVLEAAQLVTTERDGRTRECRLGPEKLDDASQWIAMYRRGWERRLDRLERLIEKSREKGAT